MPQVSIREFLGPIHIGPLIGILTKPHLHEGFTHYTFNLFFQFLVGQDRRGIPWAMMDS